MTSFPSSSTFRPEGYDAWIVSLVYLTNHDAITGGVACVTLVGVPDDGGIELVDVGDDEHPTNIIIVARRNNP
jgi:hypothetical protein